MITLAAEGTILNGELRSIAVFPFHATEFEKRFSIKFTSYVEDGLGDAVGALIVLSSNRRILLKELLEAPIPRLYAEASIEDATDEGLDDLLHELNLSSEDCLWTMREGHEPLPCALMREDDNGCRFEVERFADTISARLQMHDLSKRGHKQFYWIEHL